MSFPIQTHELASLDICDETSQVAYFSMEIAILPSMPTYSGGLGVLAGDTLRSAADRGLRLAAVTLVHRKGYFRQVLGEDGVQTAVEQPWSPQDSLFEESARVSVVIEGRPVVVRAWRFDMEGVTGKVIPIYMLDTDLPENEESDRRLTDYLYGGDSDYRLRQEAVLGIGGALMLYALGYEPAVFHMNEGHAALLTVALMKRQVPAGQLSAISDADVNAIREHCVFTTHTPVPAGHDRFSMEQAKRILGEDCAGTLERLGCCHENLLNMTYIALRFSRFVNGVAMQHGIVSRVMFPEYKIDAITNGVHAATWTASSFQAVFDHALPRWRTDNLALRYAIDIPEDDIAAAHDVSKRILLSEVEKRTGVLLDANVFTIGFARRVATYKRADLLFSQPERIVELADKFGGLQILYAGKAHPADDPGKALIRRVVELAKGLESGKLHIFYLENYEWTLGSMMTAGVDLWLNNPKRPYEASGTSGMKAALNGVPSLSVLDGWWIEGCIDGVTGWAIPDFEEEAQESASIYDQLEKTILPMYYQQPKVWHGIMRSTIALNGSFFNTQRMLGQYVLNAYFPQKRMDFSAAALEHALAR
ncbi:Glycogen phosphorylase [Acidisarcina polymorpha]|uniref:glycogen phosphorylase n=1 Tax=Acidisarcina polymorpha TaxID=2211140 RepID=A0A2Z5FY54_9BACT|nr:alpha-glucan family phosphorylase [Acidisarcina polymorpha]AXC11791.1 Glycogen phosphorylase [Acidisarcina polymorpha]